jgi:hypothetical protein
MVQRLILFVMKGFALMAAVAVALVLPSAAAADSIVYVKDGNVWLSSPDAAKQYQLTFDGGYSSPSQASDGTIAALHGKQLVRLDRSGHKLSEFNGIGSDLTPNFYGPYEPRISPDGSKIAYWFGQYTSYYSYGCYCYLWHVESNTAWSYSDRFTDPTTESEYYKGITQPEWLTNDRLLAGYDFWMNIWTLKIGVGHGYVDGAAQYAAQFKDSEGYNFQFGDPALSPDGKKLALTDGGDATNNTRLFLAEVPGPIWVGDPPYANDYLGSTPVEQPILQCYHETGVIWNPTWSSDSVTLAYSLPDGIHVMDTTNYKTGGDCPADRLLIPGGAEPAFGPKDVDVSQKPAPPNGERGTGGQTPTGPGQPDTPAAFSLSAVSLKPAKFRAAKSGPAIAKATGTALRFSVSAGAKVTLTVRTAAGKAVKGAIKTAAKPGANKLRFMGRVARKTLKPGAYRLTVTAAPLAAGPPTSAQVGFKIAR